VKLCAVLLAAALSWHCGGSRRQPLPTYGQVPSFELTDQTGARFSSSGLNGKIWIAGFIFTNCTGPCPRMSSLMKQVQTATAGRGVELVSITVDPERDTPDVLAAYARRYRAASGWHLLTGAREALHSLKRDTFKLGDVDGSLNHSTRLVLIDGQGRVRGYYGTTDGDGISRLLADLEWLAGA